MCEEGIGPNPEPFRVLSCNVNSARGAWSVLGHVETLPTKELWVLQETKMLEKKRPSSDCWGQERAWADVLSSSIPGRADVGVAGQNS